jgi:mannose-6-phosphate isomerase-like protein (cupin superfamily)
MSALQISLASRRRGVKTFHMKILFCLLSLALVQSVLAADAALPVVHLEHDKVAAAFEKGGMLVTTNNYKVMAGRRDASGPVEIHTRDTDVFYILEGSATFVTGGKATETKTVSDGEIRGKEIVGGDARHLVKGDVIVIPNGVPHWFKEVDGKFLYFVVKVSR